MCNENVHICDCYGLVALKAKEEGADVKMDKALTT